MTVLALPKNLVDGVAADGIPERRRWLDQLPGMSRLWPAGGAWSSTTPTSLAASAPGSRLRAGRTAKGWY
jgi:hypothetical protein